MESNEKEKREELIWTIYSRKLWVYCHKRYPNPTAFEQILIAFFGCIPFEETSSSDLSEKVNLLIGKIHRLL